MEKYYVTVENGITMWFRDAKHTILHRVGGPAYESDVGNKHWYVDGKLHREDGPAVVDANGDRHWYINGKLHREDGPASEYASGVKMWWVNGVMHREDGPAIELCAGGCNEWFINGKKLSEAEFNARNKKAACVGKTITIDGVNYKLTKI